MDADKAREETVRCVLEYLNCDGEPEAHPHVAEIPEAHSAAEAARAFQDGAVTVLFNGQRINADQLECV